MEYEELKNKLQEIIEISNKAPAALQVKVFDILFGSFSGVMVQTATPLTYTEKPQEEKLVPAEEPSNLPTVKKPQGKKTQKAASQIVHIDIDLKTGNSEYASLDAVFDKLPAKQLMDRFVCIGYFLQKVKEVQELSPSHFFSAYNDLTRDNWRKIEKAQTINTLKNACKAEYAFFEKDSATNFYKLTIKGENYFNHDLIKKLAATK